MYIPFTYFGVSIENQRKVAFWEESVNKIKNRLVIWKVVNWKGKVISHAERASMLKFELNSLFFILYVLL